MPRDKKPKKPTKKQDFMSSMSEMGSYDDIVASSTPDLPVRESKGADASEGTSEKNQRIRESNQRIRESNQRIRESKGTPGSKGNDGADGKGATPARAKRKGKGTGKAAAGSGDGKPDAGQSPTGDDTDEDATTNIYVYNNPIKPDTAGPSPRRDEVSTRILGGRTAPFSTFPYPSLTAPRMAFTPRS